MVVERYQKKAGIYVSCIHRMSQSEGEGLLVVAHDSIVAPFSFHAPPANICHIGPHVPRTVRTIRTARCLISKFNNSIFIANIVNLQRNFRLTWCFLDISLALVAALRHPPYMGEREEFSGKTKECRRKKEDKVEEQQRKDKKEGKEKKKDYGEIDIDKEINIDV